MKKKRIFQVSTHFIWKSWYCCELRLFAKSGQRLKSIGSSTGAVWHSSWPCSGELVDSDGCWTTIVATCPVSDMTMAADWLLLMTNASSNTAEPFRSLLFQFGVRLYTVDGLLKTINTFGAIIRLLSIDVRLYTIHSRFNTVTLYYVLCYVYDVRINFIRVFEKFQILLCTRAMRQTFSSPARYTKRKRFALRKEKKIIIEWENSCMYIYYTWARCSKPTRLFTWPGRTKSKKKKSKTTEYVYTLWYMWNVELKR